MVRSITKAGADPVYGARPLNRLLNRELLNPLARSLIEGTVLDGDEVCRGMRKEGGSACDLGSSLTCCDPPDEDSEGGGGTGCHAST